MSSRQVFRPVPRTGVIYVMTEAARRGFSYGNPDWSNLGQGAPETGPLPGASPRVDEIHLGPAEHEYAPVGGSLELRAAVARLYNERYRRGMPSQYGPENVAISPGGRSALTRIAAALDRVNLGHLLPDYTAYEELLDVFRAFTPIPIPLAAEDGFRMSPERLEQWIQGAGLGALLLSNPCNPTGRVLRGDELAAWVDRARTLGCALILDEFYSHYVYGDVPGETVSAAAFVEDVDQDPILVVDGLTKNWRYPGWRLSWTLGPRDVIDRLTSAGSFLDGGASHPLQQAAIPLLDPHRAHTEAVAIQAAFRAKRDLMLRRLGEIGLSVPTPPEGAFYCFASLAGRPGPLTDGMDLFRAALEQRVITVPGSFFDVDPGKRRDHIPSRIRSFVRLSFGPDAASVARGLDGLAATLAG
jgi:aspartate/methionine/tyrosine aminotransferase